MLLTKSLDAADSGGRALLSRLYRQALADLLGDNLITYEIPNSRPQSAAVLSALRGHIDGLNTQVLRDLLERVQTANVTSVFVDGSNLGAFVALARRHFPRLELITFFHNVEAVFFLGALRQARTPRAAGVLAANYLAERMAVRHSDKLVCMSARDSRRLQTLYGRPATHIAPLSMVDAMPPHFDASPGSDIDPFALFVGGNFYANREGVLWFARQVAPRIAIDTVIVGHGLDELRSQLAPGSRVRVIGSVDCLAPWYRDALVVIAPVFAGSGMKTKVAEALMFGKKVIGTPEAFAGYEEVAARAGWVCHDADEFVAAISEARATTAVTCDPQLRSLYEERFSYSAARSRLADILHCGPGRS
ncbi:MAG: glycosyltransferase [Halioglobus sp.]